MRNLAHVIMRGPAIAAVIAALTCFFPFSFWIGNAAVALVTLRKGYSQGLFVAASALIGAMLWYKTSGELTAALAVISVFIAALSLRSSQSWPQLLLIVVIAGVINNLLLVEFTKDHLQLLADFYANMMQQVQVNAGNASAELLTLGPEDIATYSSLVIAYTSIISIVLGRWWQSELYNPGGFGKEFRSLHLRPEFAVLFFLGSCLAIYKQQAAWLDLISLPLLVTGIALAHAYVSHSRLGKHWLILLYMLLILGGGIKLSLVLLATSDSFLDFRKRWSKSPS